MNYQALFLVQKYHVRYFCDNWLMKGNSKEQKDSKVKKTPNNSIVNHNSSSDDQSNLLGQTSQISNQSSKKDSHLCQSKKSQSSDTPTIRVNTTIVKKDKK